jgi:hypothetical protein
MSESLVFKCADIDELSNAVAELVSKRLESLLGNRERRLVDRPTMARLANIGTATLDRLVSNKRIPSVLVGRRRLFDPDPVIDALVAMEDISDV